MSKLAIVIPVKGPHEGKSRLAGDLAPSLRYRLNRRLFRHTLDQVAQLTDMADVRIVSRSPEILAESLERGFSTSLETGHGDLNAAVSLGARDAHVAGAQELMILPVDLPWMSAARLRAVVAQFRAAYDVLIVTDTRCDGTNLLLWRPIETAQFFYGIGSAARHAAAARTGGLRVVIQEDAALSFDLDTSQDLAIWAPTDVRDPGIRSRLAG
jgi:2-phospho-L-lactate/phosphoenolpyruvate guanylyltransferase